MSATGAAGGADGCGSGAAGTSASAHAYRRSSAARKTRCAASSTQVRTRPTARDSGSASLAAAPAVPGTTTGRAASTAEPPARQHAMPRPVTKAELAVHPATTRVTRPGPASGAASPRASRVRTGCAHTSRLRCSSRRPPAVSASSEARPSENDTMRPGQREGALGGHGPADAGRDLDGRQPGLRRLRGVVRVQHAGDEQAAVGVEDGGRGAAALHVDDGAQARRIDFRRPAGGAEGRPARRPPVLADLRQVAPVVAAPGVDVRLRAQLPVQRPAVGAVGLEELRRQGAEGAADGIAPVGPVGPEFVISFLEYRRQCKIARRGARLTDVDVKW